MPQFGNRLRTLFSNETGSIPFTVSLLVALVLMAQSVLASVGVGATWLRTKHEATELAKRAAANYLQGNNGCALPASQSLTSCEFDGTKVQVKIIRPIEFWFVKERMEVSSRVGINFPTP
jgi:hypothetical protein